jgi:thiosulfate/3-mercaptopyruvate sulfurtransferase
MLRAYGHAQASVLDGGLPAWQRDGHPTETGERTPIAPAAAVFEAKLDKALVADLAKVRSLVDVYESGGKAAQTVVDARSQARFEGTVNEARRPPPHTPTASALPTHGFAQSTCTAHTRTRPLSACCSARAGTSGLPIRPRPRRAQRAL